MTQSDQDMGLDEEDSEDNKPQTDSEKDEIEEDE